MFNVTAQPTTSTDNEQHRPCQNCGVTGMTNGGICARCLELPYCRRCKCHLPEGCFGDESNLCLVHSQFQLYILWSLFTAVMQPTITSCSLLSIRFQTCAKKRTKRQPRVERAVGEIVAEVHIPPTAADTSFGHFLRRNEDRSQRHPRARRTLRVCQTFLSQCHDHHHHLLHYAYIVRNVRNSHYRCHCLCSQIDSCHDSCVSQLHQTRG